MDQTLIDMLNAQAAKEAAAAAFYQSLSFWARAEGYRGSQSYFKDAHREERHDCRHILSFLLEYAGVEVTIPAVPAFQEDPDSLLAAFQDALAMEQAELDGLNGISTAADAMGDGAVATFLEDYIADEVDDIREITKIIARLTAADTDTGAILFVDRRIGKMV